MLVLDDAGIGGLGIGVVDHRVALIVVGVQHLGLKADAAVLQRAQTVAEVGIHRAGVDHLFGQCVQCSLLGQIIHVQAHLGTVQHLFHHSGIAAARDALIQRVEVVIIVGKAHRQALDDKGRQLGAGAAPLLAGVALDELFVDIGTHKADSLLFQILRVGDACSGLLLLDLGFRLGRGHHAPHLVEGVHVEGQIVDLTVVVRHRAVGVAIELCKPVHILPHSLVVGVEDMRTVAVHVDALYSFGVDIAGDMVTLINDKTLFARLFGLVGKHGTEQTGANNEIIVLFHAFVPLLPVILPACSSSGRDNIGRWRPECGCVQPAG